MESLKAEFLTLWDGITTNGNHAPVLVLGATNRPHLIDQAILRRMPRTFSVPLPGPEGREQIIRILLQDQPMDKSAEAFIHYLAVDHTKGYSGSDLKELCRTAREPIREVVAEEARRAVMGEAPKQSTQALKDGEDVDLRPVTKKDFIAALAKVKRSGQVAKDYGRQVAQESVVQELGLNQEQVVQMLQNLLAQYTNQNGHKASQEGSDLDDIPNI
jgi:SpoVK/Ycf46/Vps4 family AAA+-type ATPase